MATLEQKIDTLYRAMKDADFDTSVNVYAIQGTIDSFSHALRLWHELENITMDPATECLDAPFEPTDMYGKFTIKKFPAGTSKYDIWKWFERYFRISIAEAFMGE